MTSHERIRRMMEHKEADRIALWDRPWGKDTIARWESEGMPRGMDYIDYFGFDKMEILYLDISPGYEARVIEETDEHIVKTTSWGATVRNHKKETSTPEFIDFRIKSRDDWDDAKALMTAERIPIPWEYLSQNYARWRSEGYWIMPNIKFGFGALHSYLGVAESLYALADDPQWCVDMFDHCLDTGLAVLEKIWDAGYHFDAIRWPDDMGYKHSLFISPEMYRALIKPVHARAVTWAHSRGVKAYLHSCGYIAPIVPELVDIGLDCLNPLEVKAGMDPLAMKEKHGNALAFHGGVNALAWNDVGALEAELCTMIPIMKKNGGYIFGTDHSLPSNVSANDLRRIIDVVRDVGSY